MASMSRMRILPCRTLHSHRAAPGSVGLTRSSNSIRLASRIS